MLTQCSQLLLPPTQAAKLEIPAGATWTIFAPTNEAFASSTIKETTGLSAAQLLEPANKAALIKVLGPLAKGQAGRLLPLCSHILPET